MVGGVEYWRFLHGARHLAKDGADIVAATALTTATATYTAAKSHSQIGCEGSKQTRSQAGL